MGCGTVSTYMSISFSSAFSFLKAIAPSSGKMDYIPVDVGIMIEPQIETGIRGVNAVPYAYFVLCIHWFNPLVWLSFVLMSRDMEMSCYEQVIKELGTEIKKDYSASLLSPAVSRRMVSGSPLAFGETGVKGRIKNVLNYRRPALWVIIIGVIVVAAVGIGLSSVYPLKSFHIRTF